MPRKKLGLIVLTNLEDMEIVNAAGNNLLDHLLGLKKMDWNDFFAKEHEKAKKIEKERLNKRRAGQVRRGAKAKDLGFYVGTYCEPAYGTVKITRKGDSLMLDWSSFQLPLTHLHYDTFLTPSDDVRLPAALRSAPAVFEMNEDAQMSVLRFLGRKFARQPLPNGRGSASSGKQEPAPTAVRCLELFPYSAQAATRRA